MNNTIKSVAKRGRLFPYILALSFIFLVIQISVFITSSGTLNFLFIILAKRTMVIPKSVIGPQLVFAGIQLLITFLFAVIVWGVARLIAGGFRLSWRQTCAFGFVLWCLAVLNIVVANQLFFPDSAFSVVLAFVLPNWLALSLFWILTPLMGLFGVAAFVSYVLLLWRKHKGLSFFGTILVILSVLGSYQIMQPVIAKPNPSSKPNVIIIGIDSLRPDFTDFGGYKGQHKITPYLDSVLKKSVYFKNAITPLARTFPSWSAILTGEYPIHNGVRFNLANQKLLNLHNALGAVLKRDGYDSYYATDDRRFSNISRKFGFDQTLGPREGANDFVLGTINNLPLSNLLINSRLGRKLFPYTAGNRAAYATYYPQTFSQMVENHLLAQKHRPIFLAIHFCLPHWPYAWAKELNNPKNFPVGLYKAAVHREDQQLKQFIVFLKQYHFLDHAVVVVLSDHGEGLLLPHDRVITPKKYVKGPNSDKNVFTALRATLVSNGKRFDTSYGHGTDALSVVQYHTVLAIKTYGLARQTVATRVNAGVSMIDIKPTILSILHLPSPQTDGRSLTPYLYGAHPHLKAIPRFSETGFTPDAIKGGKFSIKNIVVSGSDMFRINPSDTLSMNPAMAKNVIPGKQRAVLYKQWLLALYPQAKHHVVSVLVNRKTGKWTDDLGSKFAQQAPVPYLLKAMKKLYGKEVDTRCPYLKGCIKKQA